ncbi:unnamed protein product [Spirodela intermedia]|uniref:Uncharacterized protein n=1 Tax=Spirodela intermedia TaxID=51605 RepID=A0A7I8J6P3_SPIIN|nr:unnamed protein product [Spirodela intermedia]CAA6665714.1 unnamed protein product [Spirodela intermedia]
MIFKLSRSTRSTRPIDWWQLKLPHTYQSILGKSLGG